MLDEISEEEMRTYIRIQNQLNRAFKLDVEESRQLSGNERGRIRDRAAAKHRTFAAALSVLLLMDKM